MQDGSFRIRRVDIPLDVDRACPGEGLNAWNAPHGSHNHSSVISLLALGEGEGSDTIARGRETPGRHDEERTSLDGGCQACLARAGSGILLDSWQSVLWSSLPTRPGAASKPESR